MSPRASTSAHISGDHRVQTLPTPNPPGLSSSRGSNTHRGHVIERATDGVLLAPAHGARAPQVPAAKSTGSRTRLRQRIVWGQECASLLIRAHLTAQR